MTDTRNKAIEVAGNSLSEIVDEYTFAYGTNSQRILDDMTNQTVDALLQAGLIVDTQPQTIAGAVSEKPSGHIFEHDSGGHGCCCPNCMPIGTYEMDQERKRLMDLNLPSPPEEESHDNCVICSAPVLPMEAICMSCAKSPPPEETGK